MRRTTQERRGGGRENDKTKKKEVVKAKQNKKCLTKGFHLIPGKCGMCKTDWRG